MKINCPSCQKELNIPDQYAGKRVKCPACQQGIKVPELQTVPPGEGNGGLDLNSLEAIENQGEALVFERKGKPMTLKQAQAAARAAAPASDKAAPPVDPRIRVCPKCGKKVKSEDIYVEMMCSHCGAPIPGKELREEEKARYMDSMANRMGKGVSFYAGFTGALAYPARAAAQILMASGIAVAIIAVPLLGILAFTSAGALNPITVKEGEDSSSWVGMFLTAMFILEAIYFGAVAYYAAIDAIRATTANNEQPPGLTWNVVNLGAALGGYAALIAFYAIIVMALAGGMPTSGDNLSALATPGKLAILALLTFAVPMNMLGLASSHAMDGLNPMRVGKSIGKTFGHYIFLFLIVLIYLSINVGVIVALMSWAWPLISSAATQGLGDGFLKMLGGVGAWGVVVGAFFYFAYCIGRVLGLFARTYREHIEFEM